MTSPHTFFKGQTRLNNLLSSGKNTHRHLSKPNSVNKINRSINYSLLSHTLAIEAQVIKSFQFFILSFFSTRVFLTVIIIQR